MMMMMMMIKCRERPDEHHGKVRNQGTTENSHIGHCKQTVGNADVKVQMLWPTRATTKTTLAVPQHPLAVPVG